MAKQQDGAIRLPLPLPVKGVSRTFSRSAQPEATCFDALNILPIDRFGRYRLSLRGGAQTIESLDAAAKVRLLHVASTIGSAAGDPIWVNSFDDIAHALNVVSGKAVTDSPDGPGNAGHIFQYTGTFITSLSEALTTGSYDIVASVRFVGAINATQSNSVQFHMVVGGYDVTGFFSTAQGPGVDAAPANLQIFGTAGTAFVDTGITLAFNTDYVLKMSFFPDRTVKLYIDGTEKLSMANALPAGTLQFYGIVDLETASSVSAVPSIAYLTFTGGSSSFDEQFAYSDGPLESVSVMPGVNRTILKLVAVSGTKTYVGIDPTAMAAATATATYPIDSTSLFVSAATLFLYTYIVDGSANIRKLNLTTNTMEAYTISTAVAAPSGAQIAAAWRGRLVLSGLDSDPQNAYASAVGDPMDWDEGVDPPTETMAWSFNAANLGRIGEPILALIPLSDDIMLVGCEQSIWAVRGDPAADGSIDNISESAGVLGQNAWCRGPDGSLYFVGPNGLYRAAADGSNPVEISQNTYPQFFKRINRSTDHVSLIFDKNLYAIWILVAPENQADAPVTSLVYHLPLEGYWPQEFTNVSAAGPLCAIYWDGYDSGTRYPVLGAYDGDLYSISFDDRFDYDGSNQQIAGYVVMGPVSLSAIDDSILTKFDVTSGEVGTGDAGSVFEMNWTVRGGSSAYEVTEGTPLITAGGTFTAGARAQTQYPRVRGGWHTLKFETGSTSGDYFSLENVVLHLLPAGIQRA